MTPRGQLETLVLRMQDHFLDEPALDLTLADAQRRFGVDRPTCAAVLEALVEAGVLERTERDTFVRFFPKGRLGPQHPVAGHAA